MDDRKPNVALDVESVKSFNSRVKIPSWAPWRYDAENNIIYNVDDVSDLDNALQRYQDGGFDGIGVVGGGFVGVILEDCIKPGGGESPEALELAERLSGAYAEFDPDVNGVVFLLWHNDKWRFDDVGWHRRKGPWRFLDCVPITGMQLHPEPGTPVCFDRPFNDRLTHLLDEHLSKEFYDPVPAKRPKVPEAKPVPMETNPGPDPSKRLWPASLDDVGQARVFADHFGDKVCYCPETVGRWMIYDGLTWREDPGQVRGFVHTLTDWQLQDAKAAVLDATSKLVDAKMKEPQDPEEVEKVNKELQIANAYLSFVKKYRYTARIEATLKESVEALTKHIHEFDADPFLLNTPGGAVNLRNGYIRPCSPRDYCAKITAVTPGHDGADIWQKFLDDLTDNNPEMQAYLQEIAGMSLIGKVFEEKVIIAVGEGGNGKSTLFNLWLNIMKDYGKTVSPDVLLDTNRNTMPARATLKGARLVVLAETDRNARIAGDKLKALCSKDDVNAEAKYCPPITFKPSHSTVLYTNHLPALDLDGGIMDRIAAVPFNHRFRNEQGEVKGFEYHLFEKSGGAVLSWMIEGAMRFVSNGFKLNTPQCVTDYTTKYFEDCDWVKAFINECFNVGENLKTTKNDMRAVYKAYCKYYDIKPVPFGRQFNDAMKRAGHEEGRRSGYRYFLGLYPNETWQVPKPTIEMTTIYGPTGTDD